MSKIVFIKKDGEVFKSERINLLSKSPYLSESEKCFDNVERDNNIDLNSNDIYTVRKVAYMMIQSICSDKNGVEMINELYQHLKSVSNKEDLLNIIYLVNKQYNEVFLGRNKKHASSEIIKNRDIRIASHFDEKLEKNAELFISILTKRIVSKYYFNKLTNSSDFIIDYLEKLKSGDLSADVIMDILGEEFDEVSKSNGIEALSKKALLDTLNTVFDQVQPHLCWEDCKNARPSKCEKIADYTKKNIANYSFITDGYQVYNPKRKELESFIVTGCKNYEKETPKILSKDESKRLNNVRKNLKLYYYGADTIEEADRTEANLVEKKLIILPKYKKKYK